jgi:signal transduction histidine kinase
VTTTPRDDAPVGSGATAARRRWLLALDAAMFVLVMVMLTVGDASQLFKVVFFLLTLGAFFWDLGTFVVRGAFWVSLTTIVLVGLLWAGRVPLLELLDVVFFVAVLVLVFTISKTRAEAQQRVELLLAAERERTRRLADLAELKADFTAMVVHEFGNPIAALRRLSEMLEFDDLDGQVKAYVLDSVRGELGTLDALVADVQSAVAVERQDFRLDIRPVRLGDVLDDACQYGSSLAPEREFPVVVDNVDPDVAVNADPERIAQILRNLISNAVKYSPAARPIRLRAAAEAPGRVRLTVTDEGRGIGPDDLDVIFDKFGRGHRDGSGGVRGVGLGLYISRRLAEAHGSELTVTSEPGAGSAFGFELPLAGVRETTL